MMKVLCCIAMLACLAMLSNASRVPEDIFEDPSIEVIGHDGYQDWLQATRSECNRKGSKCFEKPAYVSIKYIVPPDQKETFEKAFKKLEGALKGEKDLNDYALIKTKLDNVFYIAYDEWDSLYAFADHMECKDKQEFLDTLRDNGIVWKMCFLKKVTEYETRNDENRRSKGGKKGCAARFLVKYVVPPEVHEDFIKMWEDAQKYVDKEKGIRHFTLHKVAADNVLFIGCYTWESWEDFQDHLESDHGCRLKEQLNKNRVIYTMVPEEVIAGTIE